MTTRALHMRVTIAAATLATTLGATAHAQCGPGAGDCFRPHDEPGCFGVACCNEVCAFNPDCCTTAWDEFCVLVADKLCADIQCPDAGSCFEVHQGTGCDDEDCCNFMCLFDGFCCSGQWDSWCADQALNLCLATPCAAFVPPNAVQEAEECGQRLNDGCNMAAPGFSGVVCGEVIHGTASTGAPRDTDWYALTVTGDTIVDFIIEPEFPAEIMVVRGPCDATSVLMRSSAFDCKPQQLTIVLDPGLWHFVVSTATEPRSVNKGIPCPDDDPKTTPGFFGNNYIAWIDCVAQNFPADLNGDGAVDGADLGLLLGAWGQPNGTADLDDSGLVDGADLGILLGSWT